MLEFTSEHQSELSHINALQDYMNQQILGQPTLVNRMLIALLTDGHVLVEGAPGLAKTSAIKVMASGIAGEFHRIQFTPDLLPADLTGTEVFQPQNGTFKFQKGPLFHNFILADEINRSPAKVQSALLEAMAERQITVGRTTYPLDELFLVMATQNPIEQVGTYPLPEAQRDRFLLHVQVDYPSVETEQEILQFVLKQKQQRSSPPGEQLGEQHGEQHGEQLGEQQGEPKIISPNVARSSILSARQQVLSVHLSKELEAYIVQLVSATREPQKYTDKLRDWVAYGASPRGTIALALAAKAKAWLAQRDYVIPEDIQQLAFDVLRHRLVLSCDAEADGINSNDVVAELVQQVPVP